MKPDTTGAGYDPNAVPPEAAQMMAAMGPFFATFGLIMLLVFVFMIFCYWKIFAKAGYSGALSLLMLVPLVNLIVFIWFAFAQWPVLKGQQAPMKT
jgi:uncharacterized membrane protein YhaH (DUF805 family)